MVTVTTKEELELALKNKEANILVKGDLAKVMQKKKKIKKAAMFSGAGMILAGVALIPFTGGASITATMSGFSIMTAAGTTIAASTAEVAILSGLAALGLGSICIALLKEYSFEYTPDGGVKLTHK
jgi:NCAIR mutase (PurE)-related protein